ncbi:MAG: hypothetical protein MI920_33880 [Kiloniellales bacterium]|nr:hypothetical protein [Kiloniellales bacterium]
MAARISLCTAVMLAMGLALAGCDENEQGRILRYEKGTYLGPADTPLDEATRDELRQRALRQSGN